MDWRIHRAKGHTKTKQGNQSNEAGFTLVEMIVAVGLFAVVMTVAVGALLSLVAANRKAQALQSVMNNLDVALDGMVRSARMGSNFHCGTSTYTTVKDCDNNLTGDTVFAFVPYHSSGTNPPPWVYLYDVNGATCGSAHSICKSEDGGTTFLPLTAPEVSIESLTFYVIGTTRTGGGDRNQPKVVVVVKGTAGTAVSAHTAFHIQATAVQRLLDL